jgi:hypothetical protein
MSSAFDAIPKHKRIIVFKMGKLWIFKHFSNDKELFKALADYYNKDQYRFLSFRVLALGAMPSSYLGGMALTTIWWRI